MSEQVPAAEVRGLHKQFETGFARRRKFHALQDVSLRIPQGALYGFLGPNGAGKTTTIKTMTGLIFPDAGEVQIMGQSPTRLGAKRQLGYLPENPTFPDHLTGLELLQYTSALLRTDTKVRRARHEEVLDQVSLTRAKNIQIRKYSKGMVQRLGIAQAILGDPKLVILDEPMSGLDPIGRREVKDLILQLKEQGKTVFFSTHIISDVEETCDEVAILVGGRVVRQGKVNALLGAESREMEVVASDLPSDFAGRLQADDKAAHFRVSDDQALQSLLGRVWKAGGRVASVRVVRYGLEDIFLEEVAKGGPPRVMEG